MRRSSRRGQSMVETAVFGAIAVAALGFLIRVGLRVNYDQEIRMGAFRRALHAAHADNGTDADAVATLYHYIAHRQLPDPEDGSAAMHRVRTAGDGFVVWGDRLTFAYGDGDRATPEGRNTQEAVIVRSDYTQIELRAEDFPTDEEAPFAEELPGASLATRGLVIQSSLTNTSTGDLVHVGTASGFPDTTVSATTSTSSSTTLNTVPDAPGLVDCTSVSDGQCVVGSGLTTTNTHGYDW